MTAQWENIAPALAGDLVTLEPLDRHTHLDELYAIARPVEIWQWWPMNPAVDRAAFERWFDDVLRAVAAGSEARYATRDAQTGALLGGTSFCTLRPRHRSLEIGWTWLTPSAWGTGANAEAKLLQLTHAFETLGCQRVEFETDARNERSRRALEALPAQFEGVLRDWKLVADDRRRSSAVYSILDREWNDVAANLRRRVAKHRSRQRLSD